MSKVSEACVAHRYAGLFFACIGVKRETLMSISEIQIAALELLKRRYVESLTGLSRSSIYKQISIGKFPSPVKLTDKSVAWRKEDVAAWIASRNSTPKSGATND